MNIKTTIFPGATHTINATEGLTVKEVMAIYTELTGIVFNNQYTVQINGEIASPNDEVFDGDRLIATENKANASDSEAIVEEDDQSINSKQNQAYAALETAKNMIINQKGKYDKNPIRTQLINTAIENISKVVFTDEEIETMLAKVNPTSITREIKWNKKALEIATPKTYTLDELKDKVDNLKEGTLNQLAYQLLIDKLKVEWKEEIKLLPCCMPNCQGNGYIEVQAVGNGWVARCTNPAHKFVDLVTEVKQTEDEAKEAWNEMMRG